MEFGAAEFVAIGVVLLNVIVYFSYISPRKDLSDLPIESRSKTKDAHSEIGGGRNEMTELRSEIGELRGEITELRSEMNVRFSKLDESFTNHLMFMHGESRQPPTQGEDK